MTTHNVTSMSRAEFQTVLESHRKRGRKRSGRKRTSPGTGSKLEQRFALAWRALGGPELKREFRFDAGRRWKFDFAHESSRIAIECEGGTWTNGAHGRGKHFASDCEKYNTALLAGWRVFRLTTDMVGTVWAERVKELIEREMGPAD